MLKKEHLIIEALCDKTLSAEGRLNKALGILSKEDIIGQVIVTFIQNPDNLSEITMERMGRVPNLLCPVCDKKISLLNGGLSVDLVNMKAFCHHCNLLIPIAKQ